MKRLSFLPAATSDNAGERVFDTFMVPFSDSVLARVLAVAETAENIAVPAGAKCVVFNSTADFWATPDGIAAKPAADVTDGSASVFNPTQRNVVGVTNISVVSDTAGAIVTAEFYG